MPKGGKAGRSGGKSGGSKRKPSGPAVSAKGQLGKSIFKRRNKDAMERVRRSKEE